MVVKTFTLKSAASLSFFAVPAKQKFNGREVFPRSRPLFFQSKTRCHSGLSEVNFVNAMSESLFASNDPMESLSSDSLGFDDVKAERVETVHRQHQVTVRDFYRSAKDRLDIELVAGEKGLDNVIGEKSLNRPALALTGYFKHFGNRRLQLFGAGEISYLSDLRPETQRVLLEEIFSKGIPGIIVSRGLRPTPSMIDLANSFGVPVLRSRLKSKDFTAEATMLLDQEFAPVTNIHGTLMEVRGKGVLIRGESGVGKSECALALIERGYLLVADDYVTVRLVGDNTLIGSSKELNYGFMECRGIGIINVASMFGVRSVRRSKRIDLVVSLVHWKDGMEEERTGMETQAFEVLGKRIPKIQLAVRSGRDMARLVEVAVMVHTLREMGHDPAQELNERLLSAMGSPGTPGA